MKLTAIFITLRCRLPYIFRVYYDELKYVFFLRISSFSVSSTGRNMERIHCDTAEERPQSAGLHRCRSDRARAVAVAAGRNGGGR